jgi:16S rRNA (adenine1518-N6/adenine1519-N6)-dimethyltransferase
MRDLIEAKNTIEFLKSHNISAKKRYGQNFLIDRRVLERIIEGAGISKEDVVLEIGPGIGTLTQALCEAAGRVIAVEIDRDMIPLLEENLSGYENYEIINEDVLKLDLEMLIRERGLVSRPLRVAANLPYYITTPILLSLLEQSLPITHIVTMVQKEVAERMTASPGGKDYGALSVAVQYHTDQEIVLDVPPSCFFPAPEVDSAVIACAVRKTPAVAVQDEKLFFRVVQASFGQRRKTLSNALKPLGFSKEQIEGALLSAGIDSTRRGETLSLAEFAAIANKLMS